MKYLRSVVGGTFDHLHEGHKDLLTMCFDYSKYVDIGLTTQAMIEDKKYASLILPYETRKNEIIAFLRELGIQEDRFQIVPLINMYGNTLEQEFDAIFVTEHTVPGAELINTERLKKGMPELVIEVCALRKDSLGEILCSSRIREGLVNRNGFAYEVLFRNTMKLSENQKNILKEPLGTVMNLDTETISCAKKRVIVGDVTLEEFLKRKLDFDFAYIDRRSLRAEYQIDTTLGEKTTINTEILNEPGEISKQVFDFIHTQLEAENTVFEIKGEEDLLVLPLLLLLPLESSIFYGQPGKGVVSVQITEEKKEWVRSLLENPGT